MKTIAFGASVIVLVVAAFAGDSIPLSLTDASADGSPLRHSGFVVLSEAQSSGKTASSYKGQWTVKNTSGKRIVALVESVSVQYASGAKDVQLRQYELFFHPKLMEPQEEVTFEKNNDAIQVADRTSVQGPPRCEATTLWVQFVDGSTFGDVTCAESLLKDRKASLSALSHLGDPYRLQGSAEFAEELNAPSIPTGQGCMKCICSNSKHILAKHMMCKERSTN